ncbi:MAG: hypothetical protein DMF68_11730 [Acidobacteria bacterium]|nr:MAG: hypothetical protein DMF68_11730 [Acidobacteriota bacterium]
MKRSLYSLFVIACLCLLLEAAPVITDARSSSHKESGGETLVMPKQCHPGKTSTVAMGWRWQAHSHVRVYYLKSSFSAVEESALSRAVNNWNAALKEIGSSVSFTIGGERGQVSEDNASVTVLRAVPKGKDRLGQIKLYSMSNGTASALVIISPSVTDLDALTSLMTHEIGHTLGLADCYECKRGTTTMAAFRSDNKGNDVFEPSECDKYLVATGYAGEQAGVIMVGQK